MYESITMILLIITTVTGVVCALPVLGVDARILGRTKVDTNTPSSNTYSRGDKWRAWTALVFSFLALIGFGISVYYRVKPRIVEQIVMQTPDYRKLLEDRPLEKLYGKRYANETVEVDGKDFDHCTFDNVTLIYHGLSLWGFENPSFTGSTFIKTDNASAKEFMILMNWIQHLPGTTATGVGIIDSNGNVTTLSLDQLKLPRSKPQIPAR